MSKTYSKINSEEKKEEKDIIHYKGKKLDKKYIKLKFMQLMLEHNVKSRIVPCYDNIINKNI